jgi:hypothetical protein
MCLATIFHSTATITLSCMVIYKWCSIELWIIFAICSCIPLFTEILFLFSICCFKRTVN